MSASVARGVPSPPLRLQWAVAELQAEPGECILEIGCAGGVAMQLICAALRDGFVLGVDRSAAQIAKARERLKEPVEQGRAALITGEFEHVALGICSTSPVDENCSFASPCLTTIPIRVSRQPSDLISAYSGRRFDKALAVNVNAFWTDPDRIVHALRRALRPGGRAHLVYEQPSPQQLNKAQEQATAALLGAGFRIERSIGRTLGMNQGRLIVACVDGAV